MKSLLKYTSVAVAGLLAYGVAGAGTAQAETTLVVVSWGGAYTASQQKAYGVTWEAKTGKKVNWENYNGGLGEVRAQVEAGNPIWDIVDVLPHEARVGCDEGLFEELPRRHSGGARLPPQTQQLDNQPADRSMRRRLLTLIRYRSQCGEPSVDTARHGEPALATADRDPVHAELEVEAVIAFRRLEDRQHDLRPLAAQRDAARAAEFATWGKRNLQSGTPLASACCGDGGVVSPARRNRDW